MNKKIFGLIILITFVQALHQDHNVNANCDVNKN
jgi:hypothetical protein